MPSKDLWDYKTIIETHLKETPFCLSAFSFVNIFVWSSFFDFEIKEIKDNLCIFAKDSAGIFMYLPPLGKEYALSVLEECFNFMEQINKGNGLSRIENVSQEFLKYATLKEYKIVTRGEEYIYRKDELTALKGNRYKSKRLSYNQFLRQKDYSFAVFKPSMKEEALSLYKLWMNNRREICKDEMYNYMLEDNFLINKQIMENFEKLDLTGRIVRINGQIKAYSFGYPLKEDTFCIFAEIADLQFKGIATYIFKEFCRDEALKKYEWINTMDDFGLENIKRVKISYKPIKTETVCTIYRRE